MIKIRCFVLFCVCVCVFVLPVKNRKRKDQVEGAMRTKSSIFTSVPVKNIHKNKQELLSKACTVVLYQNPPTFHVHPISPDIYFSSSWSHWIISLTFKYAQVFFITKVMSEECVLHYSIYMKLQSRQNYSMVEKYQNSLCSLGKGVISD